MEILCLKKGRIWLSWWLQCKMVLCPSGWPLHRTHGFSCPHTYSDPTARLKGHIRPAETQEVSRMQQYSKDYCLGLGARALILHGSQGELKLFSSFSHSLVPLPLCTYCPCDSQFLFYTIWPFAQGFKIQDQALSSEQGLNTFIMYL